MKKIDFFSAEICLKLIKLMKRLDEIYSLFTFF